MKLLRYSLTAVLITVVLSAVPAWAQVDTSHSRSFGDSLTDNDLLFWLFDNPPELYGADPFEAALEKAAAEGDELLNFAVLGSTSGDVLAQVNAYCAARRAGELEPATLISLQAGGNDILDNLLFLASSAPGQNEDVDALVAGIKRNILHSLIRLQFVDRDADFVVWTLPDLTLIPLVQFSGLPDFALDNVRAHVEKINRSIRAYGKRPDVAVLDVYDILRAVSADPPVLFGEQLLGPPIFGEFDGIFADPIHPTAVANAILANGIIDAMNEEFSDVIPFYSEAELADLAGIAARAVP
jgi:phospholipase/lecithinase/hemolysin